MPLLATNTVILFSQVGKVEKLVKGSGHRQQFIIAELAQEFHQALSGTALLTPVGLGSGADFFNAVVAVLSGESEYALAKQIAQQTYVFSKIRVQFGHGRFLLN